MIINIERPSLSLYYIGNIIVEILSSKKSEKIDILFKLTKDRLNKDINIDFFYYALDWLFIVSLIKLENDRVVLCEFMNL